MMLHYRFATSTQVLLCKSNWSKLENLKKELNNPHIPYHTQAQNCCQARETWPRWPDWPSVSKTKKKKKKTRPLLTTLPRFANKVGPCASGSRLFLSLALCKSTCKEISYKVQFDDVIIQLIFLCKASRHSSCC